MTPPPSKRPKRSGANIRLSAPRILNSESPILNKDIHIFLVKALSPPKWSEYTDEERRSLIDRFPPTYRKYQMDSEGKLECPVTMSFLENDWYVKVAVARFKRDVELGFWEDGWREKARKAMKERSQGKFDQYLTEYAGEMFGEENVENEDGIKDYAQSQGDPAINSVDEKGEMEA